LSDQERIELCRYLARTDLFFLLFFILNRKDIDHDWIFDRIKEVEANPNDRLDLWARGHYKSTVITYAKTIQDILASHGDDALSDKELTFGIFSHTRPIAKSFLRQIKRDFEQNGLLRNLFPDVIWQNPQAQAPKWSEDDGIILRRKSNPKEATVEAWGLIDGQPTGKHFDIQIYDDVVTRESVTTPDMINKTTAALELSYNLGPTHGRPKRRFIGTRYHMNDTYRVIMKRETASPRLYPATVDGTPTGDPVLMDAVVLREKLRDMGPFTFAAQMLQNPTADEAQGFRREWLRFYEQNDGRGLNKYILVDPAHEKKKGSDYTAVFVVGLGSDRNYYVLDIVRDRLNLYERTETLFRLHRKWKPIGVGYEKYGKDSDIQHMQYMMNQNNYHFEVTPLGGRLSKLDRIKRLVPIMAANRLWLPEHIHSVDYQGKHHNLVEEFLTDEYDSFPVCVHDDMLDALSRICDEDMNAQWPIDYEELYATDDRYTPRRTGTGFMRM